MKKLFALLLSFIMVFSFVSCSKNDSDNDKAEETSDISGESTDADGTQEMTTEVPVSPADDPDTAVGAAALIEYEEVKAGCSAERYELDIVLDTVENTVSGNENVFLTNNTDRELSELCFRFFSPALTEKSEIISAVNTESGAVYEISSDEDPTVVYVSLGEDALASGESMIVTLSFVSYIPNVEDRFSYNVFEGGRLYNMNFCFPQISFLEDGEWFTSEYLPGGEALYNEMSDYYVTFKAPDDYAVLASGKQETKDGVTLIEAQGVREMSITACNFAEIQTKEVEGVTFNLLRPDYSFDNKELRDELFELTMEIAVESVELFSEKVGGYIYDELDIIPLALSNSGGMEMPGLIYIKFPTPDVYNDEENSYLQDIAPMEIFAATTHEVAHQWFYCAVGNDQFDETWLDESFASYLEYYFCRNTETAGEMYYDFFDTYSDSYAWELPEYYDTEYDRLAIESIEEYFGEDYSPLWYEPNKEEGIPYINFPADVYPDYEYVFIYSFGENFLHDLEDAMGEDKFFEMLSDWYNDNKGGIAEGYAFIQHVLGYDSSDEVKKIINTYISAENLD